MYLVYFHHWLNTIEENNIVLFLLPLFSFLNSYVMHTGFVRPGDIIRYKCHPGFSLVGSDILTCRLGERLQMDAPPPTCQGVCMSLQWHFITSNNWCWLLNTYNKKNVFAFSITILHFLSIVQCPAHDVRYDSSGVILSPGWPESYPNLQMCSWSVTVEKGYNVTITFESFHTEREFDVLEIFDGKTEITLKH